MSKRVVRMGETVAPETRKAVRAVNSVADLMQLLETEKPEVVAKAITQDQVISLIESGAVSDAQVKKLEKQVKKIKEVLMLHAQENKWKTLAGTHGVATIKPSTGTKITPTDLLRKLVALGKKSLFDSVFNVRITDARDYLGNAELADISKTTTEEYGSISLKVK